MDYRSTLNLPNTPFPMRANLSQREPQLVKRWEEMNLYHRLRESRQDAPLYVLHDGPPYANGDIHLGTGMNKILKDMANKSRLLLGFNIHYRPGWDCHGLPIENNVAQSLSDEEKSNLSTVEIRRRCRNFALKFVDKHRKTFKRLGVLGEWERPYLTLNPAFEAEELRQFAELARRGYVYQGLKPVYWSTGCETALAEAEVEYEDHVSPSIFVRFPLTDDSRGRLAGQLPALGDAPVDVVIWTTTPWTLPANRAVCLHPNFFYTLLKEDSGRCLLVAKDLAQRFTQTAGVKIAGEAMGEWTGKELEKTGIQMRHPLAELDVPLICGTHVTLEQGTGAVHTAPGHGHEDYLIGLDYKLEVFSPVDEKGCFTKDSPVFAGMNVHKANRPILDLLFEKGLLIHHEDYSHSYPHCWRSKTPIIFRATRQWFISLEKDNIRERLLKAIDEEVEWLPAWGKSRIRGMVENRQEWCISRQRAWGVPIPAIYAGKDDLAILDADLIEEVAAIVQTEGVDFWYRAIEDPEQRKRLARLDALLPEGVTVEDIRLERDILDVWFDSGVSHQAVMRQEEGYFPVDLYLEGSDQHRGWFQSSLVTAIGAGHGKPYKTVLTHGFTVDENGRKLSKSLGNFVILDDLLKDVGADIFRLWVASEDFRNDMRFSQNILKRNTESYRRLRNTMRFLLGNLDGYQPDRAVSATDLHGFDRWILHKWRESKRRILSAYERYDFHRIVYELNNFCSVDLSSLYLDVIKDRMYVSGADSLERQSAQTVLAEIATELIACVAPILSFTAEEAWQELRSIGLVEEESVFMYAPSREIPTEDETFAQDWERILDLRAEAVKAIEKARQTDIIGHSLDCQVIFETDDEALGAIVERAANARLGDDLGSILIVSRAALGSVDGMSIVFTSDEITGLRIGVDKASGAKCPRCWHYRDEVGVDGNEVCDRCRAVLETSSGGSVAVQP